MGDSIRPGDQPLEHCLAGGGETGALMRAIDWSRTALGPVASWPHSLRTVAGLCLSSRYPISIFWGSELIQLYNDAYRPILGATKHPRALGHVTRPGWPSARGCFVAPRMGR